MTTFRPRAGQLQVLAYTGGKMGISAVPGSGKTRTLAELAAKLVDEALELAPRVPGQTKEVLVVTLVNSAVDNLKGRINESITPRHLLPGFGYRVRTLHGLAHDIVRERPGLVGLAEDFRIIDERESDAVRDGAVEAWLRGHPGAADEFLSLDLEAYRAERVKRGMWPRLVRDLASAFIKLAKDRRKDPEVLLARLAEIEGQEGPGGHSLSWSLARMGAEIYADYQRSLAYRGAVDFDDLTRYALQALKLDEDYLRRLRSRWPYILEDEAQDSSSLQEEILRLLAGEDGNWVRVGDPNQAIYDTFTTADPRFLIDFLEEPGVTSVSMDQSGRSQPAVVDLANRLVDWSNQEEGLLHAPPALGRDPALAPLAAQHIQYTGPDDPQPNPTADPDAIKLADREFTPDQELLAVADSIEHWLPDHRGWTVAVLVPRNQRGFELANLLERRGIPYVEKLRSSSGTRTTAGALGNLLRCLADPKSPKRLSTAFRVWRKALRDDPAATERTESLGSKIERCRTVESYLWSRADRDWLDGQESKLGPGDLVLLADFRETARRWHRAASLPIDQLILTLAGDLFEAPEKLALAHKLAVLLRDVAGAHPTYRLPELVSELEAIARNERRFIGLPGEDSSFEAPQGKVTVSTMHRAKGLEWDRVYLMSVNNYDFPGGTARDDYFDEKWYVRDDLNLKAEALAQLAVLVGWQDGTTEPLLTEALATPVPPEGWATRQARLAYAAERVRLFYVGITRARRDLIVTWNTGRRAGEKLRPAAPLAALQEGWSPGGDARAARKARKARKDAGGGRAS